MIKNIKKIYFNFVNSINGIREALKEHSFIIEIIGGILLIPFLIIRISQFKLYLGQNIKLITYFFLFFSFIFCIDSFLKIRLIYFSELGGGIFMKIALFFSIQPSFFLSLFSFLSLVILDFFFQGNKIKNYFLLIVLILSFPIFTLYQKYFDPFF